MRKKVCPKCGKEKPIKDFYKRKINPDGYRYWCKDCSKKNANDWHKDNWLGKGRTTYLKKRFGLSLEEYEELLEQQNGCCAICGVHQSELNYSLAVDHNHITGQIRGLLCFDCNFAIGRLKDDLKLCKLAGKYLQKFNTDGKQHRDKNET